MRWTTEHEQANWWIDGLRPFNDHVVGSIVPAGFEAVARVFQPLRAETGELESWAVMAGRNGRLVHPEMQLHAIATPAGQPVNNGEADRLVNHLTLVGELPEAETRHLAELMATHTETPRDCHFGVWDGYGDLHQAPSLLRHGTIRQPPPGPGLLPDHVAKAESVGPSQRRYFLLHGALADIDEAREMLNVRTPNLWWPADKKWFVATEIDFCWTLVGGSQALVDALVASKDLEAFQSGYEHQGMVHSDTVNQ